jgi:lysyl-tRNA synthetase class I
MSMQHRLPEQVVPADAWTLFCAECSQKMRITTAAPALRGRETWTYECACGHSERIDVALHLRKPRGSRLPKLPALRQYRSCPKRA